METMNISLQVLEKIMPPQTLEFLRVLQSLNIPSEYLFLFGVEATKKDMLRRARQASDLRELNLSEWKAKAEAAKKFLEEEERRIYRTPVTQEEAAAARKELGIGDVADKNRREKYGNRYMATFCAWLLRLAEERGEGCQLCSTGNVRTLTVHHRHYRTPENETSQDLALVCKKCHANYHTAYKERNLTSRHLVMIDRENEYWREKLAGSDLGFVISEFARRESRPIDSKMILRSVLADHGLPREMFDQLVADEDAKQ